MPIVSRVANFYLEHLRMRKVGSIRLMQSYLELPTGKLITILVKYFFLECPWVS
jgi:hypothetical protein